jgi:hypothetical protein
MRKFKEVFRLKFDHDLTNRQIAKSCVISHVTLRKYLDMAEQFGITGSLAEDIDDGACMQMSPGSASCKPAMPFMGNLFQEPRRDRSPCSCYSTNK